MTHRKMLTVENAVITTATINIHVLTIEGRQVTMAVFRQLIEEGIIEWKEGTPSLRGIPWGHVRYLIEQSANHAINLIWQRGNDLRRCIVDRKRRRLHWPYEQAMKAPVESGSIDWKYTTKFSPTNKWEWRNLPKTLELSCNMSSEDREHLITQYIKHVKACIAAEYVESERWEDAYEALVAPLFDLPQLFIAT